MDTPDRTDGPMPARQAHKPPALPVTPADFDDEFSSEGTTSPKKMSARLVWRALRRYWWQALFLWAIGSAGLVTLAYYKVKPTYEAIAQFSVEPGDPIFVQKQASANFAEYRNSQVSLVTSPDVLSLALTTHPGLYKSNKLQNTTDAEGEIRHALLVTPMRETSQIQVSMTSESPEEAAAIVNSVVNAYIKYAHDVHDVDSKHRMEKLKEVLTKAELEVTNKRNAVQQLRDRLGNASLDEIKDLNRVSVNGYEILNQRLTAVNIQRIAVQSELEMLKGEKSGPVRSTNSGDADEAIRTMFYAHPRVLPVLDERTKHQDRLNDALRRSRDPNERSCRHYQDLLNKDAERLRRLWGQLGPAIRQKVLSGTGDDETDRTIASVERELSRLVGEEEALKLRLKEITLKNDQTGNDALKIEFARSDQASAELVRNELQKHFRQLDFDSRGSFARIHLDFAAKPMLRPSSNHRFQAMAVAPVGVLFAVIGLLGLLELRSGRVADPDELSSRVRLQVLGVVPPLPRIRPSGGQLMARHDYRAQRQLDEFVQSLDHLRVALCARPDPWGRNRHCVLITSACGSEGKTTLAAQLAERCVNAGLLTLLIDADLRNPTLSRMLDATGQPGLVNVLRGEQAPEDVMLIIEDAGGFHFLPAGTPRVDPSRLLQGEQLGNLLAQARESFDMIIVDAPPVLPVPDALTIGRWTDGAVLAVRYDASRFPMVERANRRLANVGVPVLGAVINGMRSSEAAYGGYYAYGGNSSAEPAV